MRADRVAAAATAAEGPAMEAVATVGEAGVVQGEDTAGAS